MTFRLNKENTAHIDWEQDAAWIIDDVTFLLMEEGGFAYEEAAERADVYVMRSLSTRRMLEKSPRA